MTTPTYTSSTTPAVTGAMPTPRTWHDLIDEWTLRLRGRPGLIRSGLDVAAVGLVAMAFARVVASPEVLFHGVFVIITLHAFLFGLRGALLRTGVALIPLLAYAGGIALGFDLEPLELTEWPLMFVIAVLVAWMADRRDSTANRYAALFREASERLLTVEEDERRRIARELHDNVGQLLTALTLTLDSASTEPVDGSQAQAHLADARHLSELALAETRDLAERLRPARLDEIGFIPALRDLAGRAGFPVHIEASSDTLRADLLAPSATIEVYRIVQEALANAARHSGAEFARVVASVRRRSLHIAVIDRGRGFDPLVLRVTGVGLAGMKERAELLGASLSIKSSPGGGTQVALSVPVLDRRA